MMRNKKDFWRRFAGKGYYIGLILCAVAIGICGFLYYRSTVDAPQLQNGEVQADPDIPAIATSPSDGTSQPTQTPDPETKPFKLAMPVEGQTVMEHSMDCLSYNPTTRDWRVHDGIDIAAAAGTAVTAAADGTVYTTYQDDTMGTTVVIRHDGGYVTTYASLDPELTVSAGDTVEQGQTLGYVGSTALLESAIGDHVHFCVALNDESVDPAELFQ